MPPFKFIPQTTFDALTTSASSTVTGLTPGTQYVVIDAAATASFTPLAPASGPVISTPASVNVVDNGTTVTYTYTPPVASGTPTPTVTRVLTLAGTDVTGAMSGNVYVVTKTGAERTLLMTYTADNGVAPTATSTVSRTVPVTEPIAYTVLDSYRTVTGKTVAVPLAMSVGTPIYGSNGSIDLALGGAVATASITTTSLPWTQVGNNDLIVVAIENPTNPMDGGVTGGIFVINNTFSPRNDSTLGEPVAGGAGITGANGGKFFVSFAASSIQDGALGGAGLQTITANTVTYRVQNNVTPITGLGTVKVGPVVRVTQRRKSIWVPTFDDNYIRELNDVIPLMENKLGFAAGTSYTGMDLIGNSLRYTLSDMTEMRARGWTFGIDSMPGDQPIWSTHAGGIADAVAAVNAHISNLVATGRSTLEEASHICFSYGADSVETSYRTVANCVSAGGTTITTTGGTGFYAVEAARGTIIKAPGVPAGTSIVSCPDQNTIIVNQAVPPGTYTLAFCGAQFLSSNADLTANGTTTITAIRTTGLVPGMVMQGRGVPGGTTVATIVSESTGTARDGTITVTNAIPATCTRAGFYVSDAEWLPGAIDSALVAAGIRTGVKVGGDGRICTQFGKPSDLALMSMTRLNIDSPTVSLSAIGGMRQAIRDGRDCVSLTHAAPGFNPTVFGEVLDFAKARMDAGELEIMSLPAWYSRISQRSGLL